jgi:hypothetical protein
MPACLPTSDERGNWAAVRMCCCSLLCRRTFHTAWHEGGAELERVDNRSSLIARRSR